MKKREFEHAIRAAGAILGRDRLLVIGSQAVHGSVDIEIPEAQRSIEVDIAVMGDKDGTQADLIDGSIGEASMFQETFGYYAQGVTEKTAILPRGWRRRLVKYLTPAPNGVTALCPELHDLWISKAVAGRAKDKEFCLALLRRGIVSKKTLKHRLSLVDNVDRAIRRKVEGWIMQGESG